MKKVITFFIFVFMLFSINTKAQTVVGSTLFEDTYVTVTGGGITTEHTNGDPFFWFGAENIIRGVRGVVGLEVGKYVTPVVGFSVEGLAMVNTTGSNTAFDQHNIVGNLKFNLSNWIGSYKGEPRTVEVVFVPGLGWGHDYGDVYYDRNYLTYNLGTEINFNLGKAKAWQINVKPVVMWNNYGNAYGNVLAPTEAHMQGRLQLGLTYKFGSKAKKSHNFVLCPYSVTKEEYNEIVKLNRALIDELNRKQAATVDTVYVEVEKRVEVPVEKEVVKEVEVKEVAVAPSVYITFDLGSCILSETEYARLAAFASELDDDAQIYLIGSADSQTGSEEYNKELAYFRANKVKRVLVEDFNINDERITIDTTLDVTDDVWTSRSVVLSLTNIDYD